MRKVFQGFQGVAGAQTKYNKSNKLKFVAEPVFQGFSVYMSREMLHFQTPLNNIAFSSGFQGYGFSSRESTRDLETRPGLTLCVLERS